MRDDVSARIDAVGLRSGRRVELGYGPHAAYTLPPEALASIGEHARARGALVHIHVAETAEEDLAQRAEYGSVPALLDARRRCSTGGCWRRTGCSCRTPTSRCWPRAGRRWRTAPGSNAKLAAGVARVTALRRAGVRVGLGTDGPASGDDLDLWAQARLAGLLARVGAGDAAALTAAELLLMATRDGAAAIGRPDLGVLEAGALGRPGARRPRRPGLRRPGRRRAAAVQPGLGGRGAARAPTCGWRARPSWPGASRRGSTGAATTAGLRAVAARLRP